MSVDACTALCRLLYRLLCEEAISITSTVNVEANELPSVVETVDGRGSNSIRVINRVPFGVAQKIGQEEPVHLLGTIHIHSHNLIEVVDAQSGRVG